MTVIFIKFCQSCRIYYVLFTFLHFFVDHSNYLDSFFFSGFLYITNRINQTIKSSYNFIEKLKRIELALYANSLKSFKIKFVA